MRAIFGTKTIHLSWTKIFCYKLVRIQNYDDVPFLGPLWSICPIFFIFYFFEEGGIITIILIYLLAPFIVQNLKKILPVGPELWEIYGPKMAYFPK